MQILNETFISVVTPVYNREDCIGRCIESVAKQQPEFSFEQIVIDDGSTDNTLSIIKDYTYRYFFIRLINYKQNKGVNYARNRGIEAAQGKFILFLDSDDYLNPNALKVIHSEIKKDPNYSHYLFRVSDRENDERLPKEKSVFYYEDWITNKVSGDFCHVVSKNLLFKYPFLEDFRRYEILNWLLILREGKKQLYIPRTVSIRDRNRYDSLSKEGELFRREVINSDYKFLNKLLELFGNDYKTIAPKKYLELIKKMIFLGLSIRKYDEVHKYFKYFSFTQKVVYYLKFGYSLRMLIVCYSYFKNRIIK